MSIQDEYEESDTDDTEYEEESDEGNTQGEIDSMIHHIIQNDNVNAQNIFSQLMTKKVSDALDSTKLDISQQLFSREKE